MLRAFWKLGSWKLWAAAGLSAGLLELPFPLAGPLPVWRSFFAWFALIPLLWALLSPECVDGKRPLRRGFLLGYLCGVLWFGGNCYWVRDTMQKYGDMPLGAPTLLLVAFSLYLGLYFGFFGFCVALVRRATGSTRWTLAAVPFLWVAMELAAARITSFPWDQLGYSQVDNGLLTQLAPWTGVYGISFVLAAANALYTYGFLSRTKRALAESSQLYWKQPYWRLKALFGRQVWIAFAGCLIWILIVEIISWNPPTPAPTATAVLVQPNLDVSGDNRWLHPGEWEQHIAEFKRLAGEQCKTYIAGIPQTGAPKGEIVCPPYPTHPDLIAWPESPAPFLETDPRFQSAMREVASSEQSPLIVGGEGVGFSEEEHVYEGYNSALVFGADGERVGRYDKIHLVPFGEYIPFHKLLTFARSLTGNVGEMGRGTERKVFRLNGHRYGVFICYESVFADEVRQFARLGAEVLVNVSDDGWYGDTSAPWQHLNMARMRAIENRRWLLRDTNNGVTAVIDPYGRVHQSIPRHQADALPAEYGFRSDVTFYTVHGDVFAYLCAMLAICGVGWSARKLLRAWIAAS
jgi:apolipoprotein N-acyltransferase